MQKQREGIGKKKESATRKQQAPARPRTYLIAFLLRRPRGDDPGARGLTRACLRNPLKASTKAARAEKGNPGKNNSSWHCITSFLRPRDTRPRVLCVSRRGSCPSVFTALRKRAKVEKTPFSPPRAPFRVYDVRGPPGNSALPLAASASAAPASASGRARLGGGSAADWREQRWCEWRGGVNR